MRTKKWLTYITLFCTILSSVLIIVFCYMHIKLGYDIAMAIFGGALLGMLMSITEYFSERRNAMENFWNVAYNVLAKFREAKPLDLSAPETLILECLEEEENNRIVKAYGKEIAKITGTIESHKAREKYLAWLKEKGDYRRKGITEDILNNSYEVEIIEYEEEIKEVIDNYISLSYISLHELDNAYAELDFLFGNGTIRKRVYENVYKKINEIKSMIYQEAYHFNLYKKGSGNFIVCVSKALELSNKLFEIKETRENGVNTKNYYQTILDEIDDSLEDFRVKIYRNTKKEYIKRRSVLCKVKK